MQGKKAIIIFVPVPQLKAFQKIETRLVRELEKKFSGKHVVFIAQVCSEFKQKLYSCPIFSLEHISQTNCDVSLLSEIMQIFEWEFYGLFLMANKHTKVTIWSMFQSNFIREVVSH